MSNKVKTPWYKPVLGFIERRMFGSFGSFLVTCLSVMGIFFAGLFIYGLLNPVNPADKIE